MTFTREIVNELVVESLKPTGDPLLDSVFDDYNSDTTSDDKPNYYRFLYRLSERFSGLTMVELGARYGGASLHFLRGGSGGRAVMIDPVDKLRCDWLHGLHYKFHQCRAMDDEAIAAATAVRPDVLLIDSDHQYDSTRDEFNAYSPLVAPGGLILFDDITADTSFCRDDFGCGRFWRELPGEKMTLPALHGGGWGFGLLINHA